MHPCDSSVLVEGIDPEKIKVMDSATRPVVLPFICSYIEPKELEELEDLDDIDDDIHTREESEEELDEILEGGKSQLQPYHDKIVENINKYLDKYEPELEGEDKALKGKQIKRLLNVLYYKSDENTSMDDRIKQLEDIVDKTSTEAKLKKIITSNKAELDSIIDSWVKPEPKKKNKKNKAKKNKVFNDTTEESIEITNNKKNNYKFSNEKDKEIIKIIISKIIIYFFSN